MSGVLTSATVQSTSEVAQVRFFQDELEFLGHTISQEGVRPTKERVDNILAARSPVSTFLHQTLCAQSDTSIRCKCTSTVRGCYAYYIAAADLDMLHPPVKKSLFHKSP